MAKNIKQGWQCPVCLVVYAPRVRKCECASREADKAFEALRPKVSPDASYVRYWSGSVSGKW